jgi:putative addiction module component (TIGR02574 family)
MNERVKILLVEAGKLARDDQIDLAESIIVNLPTDLEWDRAWAEEAQRRYDAVRLGEGKTYDADEVFADIRNRLVNRKARRLP